MAHDSSCSVTCTDGNQYEVSCSNGAVFPYSPCTEGPVWVERRDPCDSECGQTGSQRVWWECSMYTPPCEGGQRTQGAVDTRVLATAIALARHTH